LNRGVLVGLGAVVLVAVLVAALQGQFTGGEPQARVATGNTPVKLESAPALSYPQTRAGARVDEYFGVQVADPYRWLESQARESAEVAQWVAEQNGVTFAYLDTLEDRYRIKDRLTALWDYERFSLPRKEGGRYFYRKNDGLQNQYSLYVAESPGAQPQLLIDPNTWSADGATALAGFVPSPDGRLVLYGVQDGGSDWRVLKVLDIATARTQMTTSNG
jgi:prolyl oligopeptidase